MVAEILLSLESPSWEARWEDEEEIPRLQRLATDQRSMEFAHMYFAACRAVFRPVFADILKGIISSDDGYNSLLNCKSNAQRLAVVGAVPFC